YIATPAHVVRPPGFTGDPSVTVLLPADRTIPVPADVLDNQLPPDGRGNDLAVLRVPSPTNFISQRFQITHQGDLKPGDQAWLIGDHAQWLVSAIPGQYRGVDLTNLGWPQFQGFDTRRGSSGGLVISNGGVVGMVETDSNPSSGSVTNTVLPPGDAPQTTIM